MKTFLIRGVPQAVSQDSWWLSGASPAQFKQENGRAASDMGTWPALLLVALIMLGDVLIWDVAVGLSLAVFGAALILAALSVSGRNMTWQQQALVVGGGVLAVLPLVELVQPLSVLTGFVGISAVLAMLAGLKPAEVVRGALRLWPCGVRQTFVDGSTAFHVQSKGDASAVFNKLVMGWLVPISLGLVFVALLLEANPIASRWADTLWETNFKLPEGERIMFWMVLLPVGWTALSLCRMRERLREGPRPQMMGPAKNGLINPASVVRALVIFNAIFAVQTLMDVFYLYGGVGLPEGITYAEYAHRGAYPLVVTGLLAGGFALMTRRWVQGKTVLRVMLMLWVAQNVALVISSIVRLDMYVDQFGLTHMRIAAGIWMGLTVAGLALILWQVWQRRENGWLVLRGSAMTAVVLYICAFISFDAVIARNNLNNPLRQDYFHMCLLGDAAKPVIAAHEVRIGKTICAYSDRRVQGPKDWREWGFRNWRARTSLAALQSEVPS